MDEKLFWDQQISLGKQKWLRYIKHSANREQAELESERWIKDMVIIRTYAKEKFGQKNLQFDCLIARGSDDLDCQREFNKQEKKNKIIKNQFYMCRDRKDLTYAKCMEVEFKP